MSATAGFWLAGAGLAWWLIFVADPSAVLVKEVEQPAGALQSLAFVGSLLSTLGASGARAGSAGWDVLATVAAVFGMIVLTLSVSFTLGTTQTVARGRSLCAQIDILDPADPAHRSSYVQQLTALAAHVKAAPLSLYYSARHPARRLPACLVRLMQAARSEPAAFRAYACALEDLPGLGGLHRAKEADGFMDALETWAIRHSLCPERQDDAAPEP